MDLYTNSPLWKNAFTARDDGLDTQREMLKVAYGDFRQRTALLINQIHKDMPSLTVHDITHVDALWWTASEIAGESYDLNPAEALVLGGAFLLHDAAHCVAAYPGGIKEIQELPEWTILASRRGTQPAPGTPEFEIALFEVLRAMHPKQARKLAKLSWKAPGEGTSLFIFPHDDLRRAYADAIGIIAESHWASPHDLEAFNHIRITPPTCLQSAPWNIDVFKLAILLRTADAAHIDAQRAPYFLFALVNPGETSLTHWQFQTRINKVKRDPDPQRNDLCISGSAFPEGEQDAWWMAYDAARMIDRELRAADRLLVEFHRERLAARSVAFSYSPEAFCRSVPTDGWHPVDTSIRITDIQTVVERFGGEKLYGNNPTAALRELLQNAIDAIHACRELGGLGEEEGEIEVAVDDTLDGHWIHVTDTGIGMSRYVLTDVLLDFGRSLWRSADLQGEWEFLRATSFEAIGQFGIGFFSVFMLGERVRVTTRRYETKKGESSQWLLEFTAGTNKRPILRIPSDSEKLKRHGTRISIHISRNKMNELCPPINIWTENPDHLSISEVCARLAPAIDINLYIRDSNHKKRRIVTANDWISIPARDLLARLYPASSKRKSRGNYTSRTHLIEAKNAAGDIVGRCMSHPYPRHLRESERNCVGVIKGLLAGEVKGLTGVIFVMPQSDLARTSATPNISPTDLATWAERQKEYLHDHDELNEFHSALLASLGASYQKLILGSLSGEEVSYEEFLKKSKELDSILIHENEIAHDDDDNILYRSFQDHFVPESNVLEVFSYSEPEWIDKIITSKDTEQYSIRGAIQHALINVWGDVEWDEDDEVVGYVRKKRIVRFVELAIKGGAEISPESP